MRYQGLDGKSYSIDLNKHTVQLDDRRPRSSGHLRCRNLLAKLFPTRRVCEEVYIPNTRLYLDFLVPSINIAVEVQGKQHNEFTPHFHHDKMSFLKSQKRDSVKREWCEINGIKLVELDDSGTDDEWTDKIRES